MPAVWQFFNLSEANCQLCQVEVFGNVTAETGEAAPQVSQKQMK